MDCVLAGEFFLREDCRQNHAADEFFCGRQHFRTHEAKRDMALLFACELRQFANRGDDLLALCVGKLDGRHYVGLRHLFRAAFDHDQFLVVADVNQVEIAVFALCVSGVGDELSIQPRHADRGHRTAPRNIRNTQGRRSAVQDEHVRIVLAVRAQEDRDDLGFVEETFREQWTDRTVRHT